ncbi:hypothetical protein L0668_19590 [Paraglaciecola aquimarina]|uniref:Uncharacterized protein n=1 Tax=Paraglaciecola algarum TaxID=3050085 RepID=A0ABS9DFE0_9ALTE|nr:hypothetical protein [Paraglaciecola sp. G1-23]MCF2950321.1 hypothetical protein [Paraglaciecola sp. G1-23]
MKLSKPSKLVFYIRVGLFAASSLTCLRAVAEINQTFNLDFSLQNINTFGNTSLQGSGDLNLFNFSEGFNFGGTKNLKIPPVGPNLGEYGFKASGHVSAESGLRYDYDLGQHSFNLNLPMSIDLQVSEIDAQNRITISSSYSLGSGAGIAPIVSTSDAFLKIDPYLAMSAGINARACLKNCTTLINESVSIDTRGGDPDKYLIDVSAADLNVSINENMGSTQTGEQLARYADLFGIEFDSSVHREIGKQARKAGLNSLITHIPGDEFALIAEGAGQSPRNNSFNLTASGRDDFFEFGVDMINLAASMKPGIGDKVAKVLHSNFQTKFAGLDFSAGWDLLDIDTTTTAFMDQNFNFNATPTIDFMLSNNQSYSMQAGDELVIQLGQDIDFIDLTPTFNLGGRFNSTFDLGFGLNAELETLGYDLSLPIGNVSLPAGRKVKDFGIGNVGTSRAPISVSEEVETDVQIASTSRNLNQFSSVVGTTLTTALPSVSEHGTSGNDILEGTHGHDTLSGGAGNDTLIGRAGDDVLDGGSGIDTASYLDASQGVSVNLSVGLQGFGHGNDTLINIENVTGSNLDDILLGDDKNNILRGQDGADSLYGLAGDDTLIGGIGNDILDGGDGFDTANYRYIDKGPIVADGVEVDLQLGTAIDRDGSEADTLISIENVRGSLYNDKIYGDSGNNELRGDNGHDTLWGRNGDDKLYGGGGIDALNGGDGNDSLTGGAGSDRLYGSTGDDTFYQTVDDFFTGIDTLIGGEGSDTVDYTGMRNTYYVSPFQLVGGFDISDEPQDGYSKQQYGIGVYVNLEDGEAYSQFGGSLEPFYPDFSPGHYENFKQNKPNFTNTLTGIENVNGTEFSDTIYGDDSNNIINGRGGDDKLYGRGGDDTFVYSAGDDIYMGGAGVDTLDASELSTGINVLLSSSSYDLENVIGTRFDDRIIGDGKHNRLDGGAGNNELTGGNGHDTFVVHNGKNEANATNTLNGGGGNDTVLLTQQVKESEFVASYQNGDLVLGLNKGHQVILEQQYQNSADRTERLNNAGIGIKDINGSYEALVNRGNFQQYQIDSEFTTQQNMINRTKLISNAKLINNHRLTNNGTFHSDGTLENNGQLVNRGSLIVSSLFDNNGELRNEQDGVIQFLADNRVNGNIVNNGLISVAQNNWLKIGGNYSGSGFFAGNVAFENVSLNIGNSPGDTNVMGNASFSEVDFNLEVGLDSFGNIVYDTFNVLGDFTLAGGMNIGVSLLDGLLFDDVFGLDFNFINVTGDVFDGAGEQLTIDDLLAYSYEVADNVFARWNYFDDLGYSLSFSGTDLLLANGGGLPTVPSDVPAPKTLSLLLASILIVLWCRKKLPN